MHRTRHVQAHHHRNAHEPVSLKTRLPMSLASDLTYSSALVPAERGQQDWDASRKLSLEARPPGATAIVE